jgi:integrase/recombinase XerD
MQYIEQFLNHLTNSKYSPLTINFYKYYLKRCADYLHSKNITKEQQVTASDLLDYFNTVKQSNKHEFYYRTVILTKKYFQYLEDQQLILFSPIKKYKNPKQVINHHKIRTQEEINDLLNNMIVKTDSQYKLKAILEMTYSSALRMSEVLNLKIDDLDFKSNSLMIRKSKNQKSRIVPVSSYALEWTEKYLSEIRDKYLRNKNKYVFLTHIGNETKKMNRSGMVACYKYYCTTNRLPYINFHSLRASAATHMYLNGMSILHLQKLLGHSHVKVTDVYIRLNLLDLKKEINKKHPGITKRRDHEL